MFYISTIFNFGFWYRRFFLFLIRSHFMFLSHLHDDCAEGGKYSKWAVEVADSYLW